MADSPTSFARYAGVARFPRSEADLRTTTHCPACFTVITAIVCTNCGLDLAHGAAVELALVSTEAARVLDERVELIGRIRFETALAARQAAALTQAPAAVPRPELPVATSMPPPPATPPPVAAAEPEPAGRAPRRSSVQIALIVVGVSFLSIAAIYFLVYAFINYGIVWRSVIIGAITVAAFVVASVLRRRNLTSTAEGIGAFAVVLVYLDAFAIRANNLFGAASSDGLVYWGAALVLSAVAFVVWNRMSALRVGSIAAALALAPGVGLLVGGASEPLDDTSRAFAAFLAVGLAGLVHPLFGPRGAAHQRVTLVERAIAVTVGGFGLAAAFFVGFEIARAGGPGGSAAPGAIEASTLALWPVALWAVALVAAAHVVVIVRTTDGSLVARLIGAYFAALGGLAASLAIVLLVFHTLTAAGAMIGISVGPVLLVLAIAFFALRPATPIVRLALRAGTLAAAAVTVCMLLIPAAQLVVFAAGAVVDAARRPAWSMDFGDSLARPTDDVLASAIALIAVVVIVAVFARLTSTAHRLRAPLAWSGAALAVLVVTLSGHLGLVLVGWLVEAAVAVALLVWWRRGAAVAWLLPPVAVVAAVTTVLFYALSWAGSDTWALGALATIALLVAARWAVPEWNTEPDTAPAATTAVSADAWRATLLGAATVVALVAAASAGRQFGASLFGTGTLGTDTLGSAAIGDPARAVAGLAIVLFGLCALRWRQPLTALDRRVVFAIAAVGIALTAPLSGAALPLAIALLVAVLAWIVPAGGSGVLPERRVAAFALAPAAFWVLTSLASQLDLTHDAARLAAPAGALLAAAVALVVSVARPATPLRLAGDLGVAVVAVPALLISLVTGGPTVWVVLLITAVTALVSAFSASGLFASSAGRKQLGWLALALATFALWWRLTESSVSAVEAYVLPLAGALLIVAALDRRARRSSATPALVLAALVVGLVPVALSTTGADMVKAVAVAAISAALLLVGSVPRLAAWARPYLDAAAVPGLAGLVIVVVGQCVRAESATVTADVWLAAAVAVLVIAALGQCSVRPGDRSYTPRVGQAIALVALTLVIVVEVPLLDDSALGFARTVVTVTFFAELHVVGQLTGRLPFDRLTGWVSLAFATITAVAALAVSSIAEGEWVSLPIASALLVAGGVRLAREPALRSSPALGAGLLVLFVPSLLETADGSAVWRLVALGVLAIAAIVVGLVRRLQAPFVVGVVVAVVHGFTTFAPQIRAVYESTEWWVWIGIGGAVIVVLGARYERSLRTAKNVVASIGNLR